MFRLRVVMLEIFLQELNKHPEFCFFDPQRLVNCILLVTQYNLNLYIMHP